MRSLQVPLRLLRGPSVARNSFTFRPVRCNSVLIRGTSAEPNCELQPIREHAAHDGMWFYFSRLSLPLGAFYFVAPTRSPKHIENDIQKNLGDRGKICQVLPRAAEGGAFVKIAPTKDEDAVRKFATEGFSCRWLFMKHCTRGAEVIGTPWVTDIPRAPTRLVTVSPELSDEEVYGLLHQYGRIRRLDSTSVTFFSPHDAAMAFFCLNRAVFRTTNTVDPTAKGKDVILRLRLTPTPSWLARVCGWATSHPRVVLPLLFALTFSFAYAIFEPMREFGIRAKLMGRFGFVEKSLNWTKLSSTYLTGSLFGGSLLNGSSDLSATSEPEEWNKLDESAEQLKSKLEEGCQTFIALVGPSGSGKSAILESALRKMGALSGKCGEEVPLLTFNCNELHNTDDDTVVRTLATNLNYRPMFLWVNRLLKMTEVAIQGVTGQSSSVSETTDQQIARMLQTATRAIRSVALRNYGKTMRHAAKDEKKSETVDKMASSMATGASGNSSSHATQPSKQDSMQSYLESHPDQLPIIVLRGFNGGDHVCDLMAEWAANLVSKNLAQVIFVTQDSAFDKRLTLFLPNRVFSVVRVEDAAPQVAKHYVLALLEAQESTESAKNAIKEVSSMSERFLEPLGGRYTDLQNFSRRLLNGEGPQQAIHSLIHSAAREASQLFLSEGHDWTISQSWKLMQLLSSEAMQDRNTEMWLSVPGTVATLSEFSFSGDKTTTQLESVLESLERAGMLSLRTEGGYITGIKAARPLFRYAFTDLVNNKLIYNSLNRRFAQEGIESEIKKIKSCESELDLLSQIKRTVSGKPVDQRIEYVGKQLLTAQRRLFQHNVDFAVATNILKEFQWFQQQEEILELRPTQE